MYSDLILSIKNKETERINKIKYLNKLSFNEYLKSKNYINDDFLFYSSYEIFIDKTQSKSTGAIYTPEWIVYLMIEKIINKWLILNNDLWNIKILDPCCGSGNFTQILISYLIHLFLDKYSNKDKDEITNHILKNCVFSWDINIEALKICKLRIENIFNFEFKNIYLKNTLFEKNSSFDIIIGNPPYGDLLNKECKIKLDDKYKNIALNFIDWSIKNIKQNGEISFVVPHSFTRSKGYSSWRKEIYLNKNLHSIIDLGSVFHNVKLETVIFNFNKQNNNIIESKSLKNNKYHKQINYHDFFNKEFDYKMIIYFDEFYREIQKLRISYPFSGIRGSNISKNSISKNLSNDCLWFILGKNITKNGLTHIKNYDCYINKNEINIKREIKESIIAITQFGTNLKASILDNKCYASNGIVIVNHKDINQQDALNYLNNPLINMYLKKYIFNDADLTVHIDGIYLAEIPYISIDNLNNLIEYL